MSDLLARAFRDNLRKHKKVRRGNVYQPLTTTGNPPSEDEPAGQEEPGEPAGT